MLPNFSVLLLSCVIIGKFLDLSVLPLMSFVMLGKLLDRSVLPHLSCVILETQHYSTFEKFSLNINPLQCSCLENPRNREAWWAAIYGGHTGSGTTEAT